MTYRIAIHQPPRYRAPDVAGSSGRVMLDGVAKQTVDLARSRLVVTGALFALAFGVLGIRLMSLSLSSAAPARLTIALGEAAPVPAAERAPIVDRNGQLVATNLRTVSLFADPRRVHDPAAAATKLARLFPDLRRDDLIAKFASGKNFVWIKRHLTPREQQAFMALGLPGLDFYDSERRVYPQGALFSHVVGATDIDNRGVAGVERYFDQALGDPARRNRPLSLSLDVRVQHAVRDELVRAVAQFRADGAGGIVLDVLSGEVIAMVSLPDYDPAGGPAASGAAVGKDDRFNRLTAGVYEMGSVMKALTAAMALDGGVATEDSGYDASQPIHAARFVIRDYHAKNRWLSLPEVIIHSSNIGAAKMALDVGADNQRRFLDRFGMLRRPTLELPEIGQPLLPQNWKLVETMTIGYGHGLAVSPLQLAAATSAIVNGGVLRPSTLLKRAPGDAPPGEQVIAPDTSAIMRRLLTRAVDEGTGKRAAVPGYAVGGKTGTAEKVSERGGYERKALLNTFVGAFPMTAPRYVVLVLLDEPVGTKETQGFATAGWTVAPTTARIVARIAPMLGVIPIEDRAPERNGGVVAAATDRAERKLAAFRTH